jgi:hypothetical protein
VRRFIGPVVALASLACSHAASHPPPEAAAPPPQVVGDGPLEPLPHRPLDAWEQQCLAEAQDADAGASSCLTVLVDNEMSSALPLVFVTVLLDGQPIFTRSDLERRTDLSELPSLSIFRGKVSAGEHDLATHLAFELRCYGVYSYCPRLRLDVLSRYTVSAQASKVAEVHAVAYERGGVTTPIEKRPALKYRAGSF